MTIVQTKYVSWTLTAAAFLAIVGSAGCSRFGGMFGDSRDAALQVPVVTSADDLASADSADTDPARPEVVIYETDPRSPIPVTAPAINVFGEFDGVQRPSAKPIGEANFQQHTFVSEGYDADVSVDPTGRFLVFASTRHSPYADIYIQRVDGTSVTQLTSDTASDAFPTFSPDGSKIAFCSTRNGSWDIYVMDADGRNVVQVTNTPLQEMHPSFSPDGTRLVYCAIGGRSDQWELWVVNLLTNEKRMVGYGLFPSWSPEKGRDRIAFQRARQRGSRWFSLWTLDLIDGEARNVTEVAVSTNAAVISPSWSPDGRQIAFATVIEPALSRGDKPSGQQDIWIINADGTNRRRLTDGNGSNLSPYWSVDNRVFFISSRGGTECIWSARTSSPTISTANAGE
jgi:TolB protein